MAPADAEALLISKVVYGGLLEPVLTAQITAKHFHDEEHGQVWDWLVWFYEEYGSSPSRSAVRMEFPTYHLIKVSEPIEYCIDRLRAHHKRTETYALTMEIAELAKAEDIDGALALMSDGLLTIANETTRALDINLTALWEERMAAYDEIENMKGELVGIPTGFPTFDEITGGYQKEQMIVIVGPQKAGKAQPLWEVVLTPQGWRSMGDLRIGDRVIGRNGQPTTIIAVPYEGVQVVYRVTFSDGAVAHAGPEHVWRVEPRDSPARTLTTVELARLTQSRRSQDVYMPMVGPVHYDERPIEVDPYLLGLLLGDGCFRGGTPTFTTIEPDLLRELNQRLPSGVTAKYIGKYGWRLSSNRGRVGGNPLTITLRRLGLMGHSSLTKFIPENYLFGSVATRMALLRGLMDTDGGMENSSACFCTSSPYLAEDFRTLVRSLGGLATMRHKKPMFNGKPGAPAFVFSVRLPQELGCPFGFGPKVDRWSNGRVKRSPIRTVKSVEVIGIEPTKCITVGNQDGLYVTRDFVVTHNSTLLLKNVEAAAEDGRRVLFVGFEMSSLEQAARWDGLRAGIDYNRMLNGNLSMADKERLKRAGLSSQNLEVMFVHDPTATTTMSAVAAKAHQYKPNILFIDGVYLMDSEISGVEPTDTKSLTKISRTCKRLAQSLEIPVVISTQALDWKWNPKQGLTARSVGYCVDDQTEIFTDHGWVSYDYLHEGDMVLTLDHADGRSEWQSVQEVCVFPAMEREMIRMEGQGHSSLTTPNHRWPVMSRRCMRRKGWPEQVYMAREWRTTETLKAGDAIPLAAYGKDVPLEPTYDDAFVELVAWFWTEGGKPRGNSAEFWLNSKAARLLWEVAPGKVVSFEFLLRLTQQQLDLFIEVSMLADNGGERILAQKDIRRTEAFQFACILAGRPTTQTVRPPTTSTAYPMHGVYLKKRQVITPIESAQSGHRRGRGWGIKQELYSGIIWCPRTLNQSWLARRNGTVYFTGNTSAFSQDCDWMFGVEPADDEGIAKVRLITGRRYAKKLIAVKFDWPRGTIEEVQGWDDSDYGDDQMDDA